jgi:hypothetical protein
MFVPSPDFFAVIRFWIWWLSGHWVNSAPASALRSVVFTLFPLGAFLQRDVSLFHPETPPKTV